MSEINGAMATGISGKLVSSLQGQLAFQRKWQRLSMFAYVLSTVGILLCSTLATLCAARQLAELAAYLSASTTILVGLEKSMLFREKWKLHLGIATRLSVLAAKIEIGEIQAPKGVEEYASILKSYSETLPVAPRETAN
jgi:hypothetical protein